LVFLEAPHRLVQSLEDIQSVLGEREIAVARELTKIHEEIFRGPVSKVNDHYQKNEPRGEITLIISGDGNKDIWPEEKLLNALEQTLNTGELSPTQLAKSMADKSGWSRRDIYDLMQGLRNK